MKTQKAILDVTKFSDTLYKGEARSGYSAKGGGLGADVSINPGSLVGLQASIGLSGKVSRASQCMIVVHRGPAKTLSGENLSGSLIVNNFVGVTWMGKAGVTVELGVKALAGGGLGTIKDRDGNKTDFNYDYAKTLPGDKPWDTKTCSIEALAAGVEAKAGLSLNASGEYSHYYAKCVAPLFFETYGEMKDVLEKLLLAPKKTAKANKEAYKKTAIEFMNKHKFYFGLKKDISYSRRMGLGHIPSSKLVEILKIGLQKIKSDFTSRFGPPEKWPDKHTKAVFDVQKFIKLLVPSVDGTAFINISSKNGVAGMKLGASACASLKGCGVAEVGVALEANLVQMEYNKKWTHIRFQSYDKTEQYIWTHDTSVVYNNSKVKFLSGVAKLNGRLAHKSKSYDADDALFKPVDYNWISYKAAIIYWSRKSKRFFKGSGLANGRSYSLETLYGLYRVNPRIKKQLSKTAKLVPIAGVEQTVHKLRVRAEKMLEADLSHPGFEVIAKSLNIPVNALEKFLNDPVVCFMISDLYHKDKLTKKMKSGTPIGAAFIEVSYRLPKKFMTSKVKVKKDGHTELDAKTSKEVRTHFDALTGSSRDELLSAIRLRVRQLDLVDKNHNLFSLGFKVAGTGAKITLEKVDKAGAGGFVELRSVFLKRTGRDKFQITCEENSGTNYKNRQEKAVPPANLYCQ